MISKKSVKHTDISSKKSIKSKKGIKTKKPIIIEEAKIYPVWEEMYCEAQISKYERTLQEIILPE